MWDSLRFVPPALLCLARLWVWKGLHLHLVLLLLTIGALFASLSPSVPTKLFIFITLTVSFSTTGAAGAIRPPGFLGRGSASCLSGAPFVGSTLVAPGPPHRSKQWGKSEQSNYRRRPFGGPDESRAATQVPPSRTEPLSREVAGLHSIFNFKQQQ